MDFGGFRTKMQALRPIRFKKADDENVGSIDDGQPLSPMARLSHQTDTNVYIIIMIGFKIKINPDIIKANLVHTLLKHPRFSQAVDEKNDGEMKWVKTKLDLDNHVEVPKLDSKKDSPDKFVEDYVSSLSKTRLSISMPMWDLHLLNVKTSDAESVAILRVHHSVGDATSLMSLLLSCTRRVSDPELLPTIPVIKRREPGGNDSGSRFWQYFFKVRLILLLYWNTFVDVVMILVMSIFHLEDTRTPLKAPSGVAANPRRFVHRVISLDDVLLVKNAMNATINDVMVAFTQAGLSRYLNRKYSKDEKNAGAIEGSNYLPKNICVRALSFVNIRPSPGNQAFADMIKEGTKARWGNHIGFAVFPFTIALQDNPLDYIRHAKANGKRKRASLEAKFIYFMAKFKIFHSRFGSFPNKVTFSFSNVAGPQEEISYCEHPVQYIALSCYGQPHALLIHVVTYANQMRIVLSVDESIIPDPHQLCDDFEESFKLIKETVLRKVLGNYGDKVIEK